jgi:lipopolysaccharide transport system ATP-binding protein
MSDTIIKVEGLHKKFCRSLRRSMAYGSLDVGRSMLGISYDRGKLRHGEFWALEDVNLELKRGEALGLIGQNGSGKTTLLRLINGIFPPDKGRITVKGRIGALLAVGAGFHPHMTGRENIYLNGTILGMTKKEINQKMETIVDFADIGDFLEAPVASYSSGMTVRLGFSIAIHSNPEMLLADEVLAVGDLAFALKCYRKVAEYRKNGGSLILVSHGMQLVRNTCQKVMWINSGKTQRYGNTQEVCDAYENYMSHKDSANSEDTGIHVNNDPSVQITKVEFLDDNNSLRTDYISGQFFKMRIHFNCGREVIKPIFTFGILTAENIMLFGNNSNLDCRETLVQIQGKGFVDVVIKTLSIKPGSYLCTVTLSENEPSNILDWHERRFSFSVVGNGSVAFGLLQLPVEWQLQVNAVRNCSFK